MARQIFRKEALDRLASPEQLDQLMRVARPRTWVALAAVGLVLITALLWGIFGTIPTTVETQGVLLRRGGVATVTAPIAGAVMDVSVMSGDGVADGQELLRLAPNAPCADAVEVPVRSPFAVRVLQRSIREGQTVKEGDPLLVLEPLGEPLRAQLFVPVAEGYSVQPGMAVRVWPASANRSESGYLIGKVRTATKFPITQPEMARVLQSEDLAHQLSGSGPYLQAFVELATDPRTASGYAWSSARGGDGAVQRDAVPGQHRPRRGAADPARLPRPRLAERAVT